MPVLMAYEGFAPSRDVGVVAWDQPPVCTLPVAGMSVLARVVDELRVVGAGTVYLLTHGHVRALREALAPVSDDHWQLVWGAPGASASPIGRALDEASQTDEPVLLADMAHWFRPADLLMAGRGLRQVAAVRLRCPRTGGRAWWLSRALADALAHLSHGAIDELLARRIGSDPSVRELLRGATDADDPVELLNLVLRDTAGIGPGYREARPGIWVHSTANVDPTALDGASAPVFVGAGTRIASGVVLEGPVEIGHNCQVDSGAEVIRSLVGPNTHVGGSSSLRNMVARQALLTRSGHTVRVEEPELLGEVVPAPQRVDRWVRAAEMAAGGLGLALVAPILAVSYGLVRLTSNGPGLYRSRRVIRPARQVVRQDAYLHDAGQDVDFPVLRTMVVGADSLKGGSNLYARGPFSKVEGDSRVTTIGRLLRKTSIDELPLLYSVMRGELGLVGLWALPRKEAQRLGSQPFALEGGELTHTARRRFRGRPGLAGLWQSQGRSRVSAEVRALYDAYQAVVLDPRARLLGEYRRYRSVWGRLGLFSRTVHSVLARNGAI